VQSLTSKASLENIITITITISTGRIKIEGHSIKADIVEFAQSTKKEIQNLTETLTKKDQEIELLRNDLNQTKTKSQQSFSDLTIQQMEMETKFNNLQEKYKILADKNTKLLCQISTLRDDSLQPTKPPVNTNKTTDEPKEEVDLTDDTNSIMETYNIPTANKFENLTKQDEPTNENQQIKTNKDQTANNREFTHVRRRREDDG
jgi:hypothetical protein